MSRLKLCPFCGKTPVTVVDDETEEKFGVKCFSCGGAIYPEKETLDEATEAWNRRATIEPERKNCVTCRYNALQWDEEPCDGCTGDRWESIIVVRISGEKCESSDNDNQ